jgi:hypothetical protein
MNQNIRATIIGGDICKTDYQNAGRGRPKQVNVRKSDYPTLVDIIQFVLGRPGNYRIIIDGGGGMWYLKAPMMSEADAYDAIERCEKKIRRGKIAYIVV